jgi:hypothetical protein
MDLRTYLFKNRISQTSFAKDCDCSKITINSICSGKRPGKGMAKKIQNASGGIVSYPDILKDEALNSVDLNV